MVASRHSWAWGNEVRIDHGRDASGLEVHTLSIHLHERMVTVGETVHRGQQIGTMGITGMAAGDPPHLHFVVYARPAGDQAGRWRPVNPHQYWSDGVGRVTCYDTERDYPAEPLSLTYPVPCRHH